MQPFHQRQPMPHLGANLNRGKMKLPQIDQSLLKSQIDSDSELGSNIGFKPLRKVRKGYQLAEYQKAVENLHTQSYYKKVTDSRGRTQYEPYQSCVDSKQLKQYGLGVYLYLQFVKRLSITLIIMSCILSVPTIYCYMRGTALQSYTQSYMITMAKMSLGNIQYGDEQTYMFVTVCDILSMIVLFLFYLHWRSFHEEAVESEQKDHTIVNPTSYVLSVVGFEEEGSVARQLSAEKLEAALTEYFDKMFNGAYEVEVVYNYAGNFSKFVTYDELIEKKEKQKQVMNQTDKDNKDFLQIESEIRDLEKQLSELSQTFEPMYAIVHFRTLRARNNFINFCRRYSLVDKFSYNFKRFICCAHSPPRQQQFLGAHALRIKQLNLSRPQQINWGYLDVSTGSRVLRWILSILALVIAIAITSSLIALCTLYVSSTSACVNYDSSTLLADAKAAGGQTLYCFCAANFAQILSDTQVNEACGDLSNTILIANIMQVGASLASAISNLLLIFIVSLIAKHLLKPDSKPKQYSFVFVGVFLSNYINASILPLVMNGNIFGFQSLQYLTFIDFIDFNKVAVFQDFDTDWYAVVAPYYMNFLIIAAISPVAGLLAFVVFSCWTHSRVKKACEENDPENPIIQKQANSWLASLTFDLPTEQALICLYFFMTVMYSSFIPLLVPITAFGSALALVCKKQTLLRYSLRVPADQALSEKTITLIPFAILAHYLMGIWSHTSEGTFANEAYIVKLDQTSALGGEFDRVLADVLMLAALGLIILWILFEYTLLSLFGCLKECCLKDDLEVPVQFASIENKRFSERIKNANVLGSYKIVNNPTYGHAIKAFKELKRSIKKEQLRSTMKASQQMKLAASSMESPDKKLTQEGASPQKTMEKLPVINEPIIQNKQPASVPEKKEPEPEKRQPQQEQEFRSDDMAISAVGGVSQDNNPEL